MSAGMWCRMREVLAESDKPLTANQLARKIGEGDPCSRRDVRNILYIQAKHAIVEKVGPSPTGREFRWRLLRDARTHPMKHDPLKNRRGGKNHAHA